VYFVVQYLISNESRPLPTALFTLNRGRLSKAAPRIARRAERETTSMPRTPDGTMGHLQKADLFYLTGVHQEERAALAPNAFDPNHREILFIPPAERAPHHLGKATS